MTSRVLAGLESVLITIKPSIVVVQGDTTITLCAALAAFYAGVPVAYVEEACARSICARHSLKK